MKTIHESFFNEDGSPKQEFLDDMDKYFADKEAKEKEYLEKHFEHDKEVAREFLKEYSGIDTDMNDYEHKIDIVDLTRFASYMFHHANTELPIPNSEGHSFTAGIRVYEDFEIELVVGQGSFYWIKLHDASLHFGEEI